MDQFKDSQNIAETLREKRKNELKRVRRWVLATLTLISSSASVNKLDSVPKWYRQATETIAEGDRERILQELQNTYPHIDQFLDRNEVLEAVESVTEEFSDQLPAEVEPAVFSDLLLSIAVVESGIRNDPRALSDIPVILERDFGENTTTGVMQSDTLMVNDDNYISGFRAGASRLVQNLALYSNSQYRTERLRVEAIIAFAIADYNAGRGSSWRAGIQKALNDQGYLRSDRYDGRIGKETENALINYFETEREKNASFMVENYEEYIERIRNANTDEFRTWWTITNSLDAHPMLPDIKIVDPLKRHLMAYGGEPTSTRLYVEEVLAVYNQIQGN